jgi:hypothetical protein
MSDLFGDRNYIDKLLNAISVEDAISSFSLIDEKVIDLLKCSSDDFLSLNDHFKNYHKESKNIAQNASNIIQTITDPKINDSFSTLKSIAKNFNNLSNNFTNRVEILDVELKKAINNIENIKSKHNNYRQNISSIKVLLANPPDSGSKPNIQKIASDIEKEATKIKDLLSSADKLADMFIEKATESYLFLSNIKKENYDNLSKLNDNLDVSFSLFNKKYKEASLFYKSLKEQTDKNSENIDSIITNLQYHDIIRQKIEHIQRTHKDIINELKSFHDQDSGMAVIHNKVKTFIKIRDVAGLQAAQLIHANNQYQLAIDEISRDLGEIGNEMISISSMCDNLVGKSEQAKDYYLNNIVENLNNALSYNHKLIELVAVIRQQMEILDQLKNNLIKNYDDFQIHKDEIRKLVKEYVADDNRQYDEKLSQTIEVLKETEEFSTNLNLLFNDLKNKFKQIFKINDDFQGENNLMQSFDVISITIPGLIELLKQCTNKVDEFLFVNSTISLNVSDSIRNSLNNIRYYVMFEKSCEIIIEELNSINLRLNNGEGLTDKNREENLKLLKSRYTMASEHIIHDHLSKTGDFSSFSNNSSEQILKLANQNSSADDDNLELF